MPVNIKSENKSKYYQALDEYRFSNKLVLDIDDYDDFEREIEFKDCDNIDHCFHIIKRINPVGIFWEAIEFLDRNEIGYLFQVSRSFEDDPEEALKSLYKKIENGYQESLLKKGCNIVEKTIS